MAKLLLALLLVSFTVGLCLSLPPDEERYLDKEYTRELISWLASLNPSSSSNPCKYYGGGNSAEPMAKRNSELINSLLSLPKTMNDAGK